MKYNPEKHHRHSIRLKSYNYSSAGGYFVTICTHDRKFYFQQFPQLKKIVEKQWQSLTKRFQNILIDTYVIMPNHIHVILFITETTLPNGIEAQNFKKIDTKQKVADIRRAPKTLGEIIGSFKSKCVHEWLKVIK